mmetsp:Transcript_21061/g.43745  ORF Transcript_21061/g.43745 Transcript_21061/m.43745 type:complete len:87 (+) Transcript_21061:349-609(+)
MGVMSILGKKGNNHEVAIRERGRPLILRGRGPDRCQDRGLYRVVVMTKQPENTRMKEVESAAVEAEGQTLEATLLVEVGKFKSLYS